MANTFRVSFYLRKDWMKENGEVPIMVRIYLRNERVNVGSTKIFINPTLWDGTSSSVKGRSAVAIKANAELRRIEQDLMMVFRRYEFRDDLSLENIKNTYLGKASNDHSQSFLAFYDTYVKKIESEVGTSRSKGSLQKYQVTSKHFKNFLKSVLKKNDIKINEFNEDMVFEFFDYLIQNHLQSHNTGLKTLQNLHTVILYAIRKGIVPRDPFLNFQFRFKERDRGFLDDDEINRIMSHNFSSPRLELVRDIFIFSCFTGLAYIDVSQLSAEHIVKLGNIEWIMKPRHKTGVPSRIPLLDVPKKIIVKYAGKGKDGRLLPVLSNQKFNAYLKEIADICGIKKNLTFHLARDTFATLALSKGVPVETVSKMMGHTNIKTTQIYAKITNKKIESDMEALASQLMGFKLDGETNEHTAKHSGSYIPEEPPVGGMKPTKKRGRPKKTEIAVQAKSKITDRKDPGEPDESAALPMRQDETVETKPAAKRGRPKKSDTIAMSQDVDLEAKPNAKRGNLDSMEIVQCRGKFNRTTDYHDRILSLMKRNMSEVAKRMSA